MAIGGRSMPGLHVKMDGSRLVVLASATKQASVLQNDLDCARTLLMSRGSVWIPARLRMELEKMMTGKATA